MSLLSMLGVAVERMPRSTESAPATTAFSAGALAFANAVDGERRTVLPSAVLPDAVLPSAVLPDAVLPDAVPIEADAETVEAESKGAETVEAESAAVDVEMPEAVIVPAVPLPVAEPPLPLLAAEPGEASGAQFPLRQAQGTTPTVPTPPIPPTPPVAQPVEVSTTPVAAAPAAPVSAPPPAVAPPAGTPTAARPGLLPQVSAPVLSLARAADGNHQMTLTVSPENLGPVTVRAHISGDSIRIEMHAPNDFGRDALRAILGDLRRDLFGAAPTATLAISTHDGPSGQTGQHGSTTQQHNAQQNSAQQNGSAPHSDRASARDHHAASPTTPQLSPTDPEPSIAAFATPHGGIDVFA